MAGLKPSEEIMTSAFTAVAVYSIFQVNTPKLADVKASKPGNVNVYRNTKIATWTAAAVVSGLAILAKSPTVFVVGGLVTAAEAWKLHYANNTQTPPTAVIPTANQ